MGFEDGESMDFTEEEEKDLDAELEKVNKPAQPKAEPKAERKIQPQQKYSNIPISKEKESSAMPEEYNQAVKVQPKAKPAQAQVQNDIVVVAEIPKQETRVVPTEKGQITLITVEEALTEILRIMRTLEK